jgi:hypothetical protein
MELYDTRPVLRGRILSALGFQANDTDAVMILDQLNELIREACVDVAAEAWWARRKKEWRGTLGVDQRLVNIPSGASIGDVIEVGVWDSRINQYHTLEHATIPVALHTDPLDDVGGEADAATRSLPQRWSYQGTQIEVWPESDEASDIKILYVGGAQALTDDSATSEVDVEAIHRRALQLYWTNKDDALRKTWEVRYHERIRALKHWAHTCETVSLDPMVRMSGDRAGARPGSRFDYATAIANRS